MGLLRRDFDKTVSIACRRVVHKHFVDGFVTGLIRLLTEAKRLRAIGMLQTGSTQVQTANVMNTSQSVVSRLCTRYQRTGAAADLQKSGRLRSTSNCDDRLVVKQALRVACVDKSSTVPAPCSRVFSLQVDHQKSGSRGWTKRTTSASCIAVES